MTIKNEDRKRTEILAAIEHDRWSEWEKYRETCVAQVRRSGDTETHEQRWKRLRDTPYNRLTDQEKESDRVEARKSLAAIHDWAPALSSERDEWKARAEKAEAACRAALPHHQGGHSQVGKMLRDVLAEARGRTMPGSGIPLPHPPFGMSDGEAREAARVRAESFCACGRRLPECDMEKKLAAIAMLVSIFERQRENEPDEGWPEGDLHPSQVLLAIGETIGDTCSICRSRHGSEVRHHACE